MACRAAIQVRKYEELVSRTPDGRPLFADCTQAVLGRNRSFHQQLTFGLHDWIQRIELVHRIKIFGRNGLALGDVNGDGLDDVYVCQPGGLPNRLYVQQQDGTCVDRSREAAVDWLDQTSAALFVDLDNDGDQYLIGAVPWALLISANDGRGRFDLRGTLAASEYVQTLSVIDFDNNRRLDIYVCHAFASAEYREDNLDAAIAQYRQAIRQDSNLATAHFYLGVALWDKRETSDALVAYRSALQLDPQNAVYPAALGIRLRQLGQREEASRMLERAARLDPTDSKMRSNLRVTLCELGRVDAGVSHLKEAARLSPNDAALWAILGMALARHDPRSALDAFREAIRLDSESPTLYIHLGRLLTTHQDAEIRNGKEAVIYAKKLVELTNAEDARALDLLAAAHAEAGKFEDAVDVAQQAEQVARKHNQLDLAKKIRQRLSLYRGGRTFRSP